jgi:hypothetical protein
MATVLLAAASRQDAAWAVAERLGKALTARHVTVDLRRLGPDPVARPDVGSYDAVVLGSSVRAGRWLEPASRFAAEHGTTLCRRPVWVFSCEPVTALTHEAWRVRMHGLSAGAAPLEVVTFTVRAARPGFPATPSRTSAADDRRTEWRLITAWADGVAALLDPRRVRTA